MRDGDLKWNGPREGLVKCLLSRNRWYFAFCLTIPPEIVMSSVRTQICIRSIPPRSSQHFRLPWTAGCFNAAGIVRTFASFPAFSSISFATHDFLAGQQLLGNDRREPAKHVVFAIDDDDLRDACSIAVPGKKKSGSRTQYWRSATGSSALVVPFAPHTTIRFLFPIPSLPRSAVWSIRVLWPIPSFSCFCCA